MNRKKSLAAVLLLCTVFGFTACGTKEQTKNGVTTKKVDKQAATDISNVHLRDKKSLYDKDHTKVTTMYLTVRRGDATENQNHSWSEVNQYSVEDYQKMGVKRYQVAGLLQVGNEYGPVSWVMIRTCQTPVFRFVGKVQVRTPKRTIKSRLKRTRASGTANVPLTLTNTRLKPFALEISCPMT